ncbi:hypothetical protein DFLDMN_001078 [Cupriavidus sp. H19C3]|uniref:gp53-like domain-containing protein n=1 Tax=Cupriavidus sp. H19C3 TaxID=3241603 RepID=UPI003BF7D7E2
MQDLMSPVDTQDSLFHDGNPANGTIGTLVTALWLNAVQSAVRDVQSELKNLLTGFGGTLDVQKKDQLKTVLLNALANYAPLDALGAFAPLNSATLTGTPKSTTPDQFDNTKRIATMDAVQRAVGNMAGVATFVQTGSVSASVAGKWINCAMTATGQVLTLPALSAVPDGATFIFQSLGNQPFTIVRAGTDQMSANGGIITGVLVKPGDVAIFTRAGGALWAFSGSAALRVNNSDLFGLWWGSSIGYQRLPSGLILQWTSGTVPHNALQSSLAWPIAFPSACLAAWGTIGSGIAVNAVDRSIGVDGNAGVALVTVQSSNSGSSGVRCFGVGI